MAVDLMLFVSKRASVVAAGLLCLVAAHLALQVAAAPAAASASEVRVDVAR